MYINSLDSIALDIEYQERCLRRFKKRLRDTAKYENYGLVASCRNGIPRYYMVERVNGEEVRRYLGCKDVRIRKILQERHYLKKAIDACERNLLYLNDVVDNYESIDPACIVRDSAKAFREQDNARKLLYGVSGPCEWKEKALKKKEKYPVYRPEDLKHTTIDGSLTRSKSEALIYNMLMMKAIPFVYELPIRVGGVLIDPDFTIYNEKTGYKLILEHLGMTGDEDYRAKQFEKLDLYLKNGFIINRDLILSCDSADGIIDVYTIAKTVDNALRGSNYVSRR